MEIKAIYHEIVNFLKSKRDLKEALKTKQQQENKQFDEKQ